LQRPVRPDVSKGADATALAPLFNTGSDGKTNRGDVCGPCRFSLDIGGGRQARACAHFLQRGILASAGVLLDLQLPADPTARRITLWGLVKPAISKIDSCDYSLDRVAQTMPACADRLKHLQSDRAWSTAPMSITRATSHRLLLSYQRVGTAGPAGLRSGGSRLSSASAITSPKTRSAQKNFQSRWLSSRLADDIEAWVTHDSTARAWVSVTRYGPQRPGDQRLTSLTRLKENDRHAHVQKKQHGDPPPKLKH